MRTLLAAFLVILCAFPAVAAESALRDLLAVYATTPQDYPTGKEFARTDVTVPFRWHSFHADARSSCIGRRRAPMLRWEAPVRSSRRTVAGRNPWTVSAGSRGGAAALLAAHEVEDLLRHVHAAVHLGHDDLAEVVLLLGRELQALDQLGVTAAGLEDRAVERSWKDCQEAHRSI